MLDPDRVVVAQGPRGGAGGGGGFQGTPTYLLQNDRHVALIILRYAMLGSKLWCSKTITTAKVGPRESKGTHVALRKFGWKPTTPQRNATVQLEEGGDSGIG